LTGWPRYRSAKVIAGGKSDRYAHYLDPHASVSRTWDDKIMEDEVFGTILPILTISHFDEAMVRNGENGTSLAGFIFSRDQKPSTGSSGSCPLVDGGVNLVNVTLFVEPCRSWYTGSPEGHYYGKYGFDALTTAKSMLISPPDVAIEHLYSPFTEEKNRQLRDGSSMRRSCPGPI